jgi:hypothetical protein
VAFAVSASAEGGSQPPPTATFTASNNEWYVAGTTDSTATITAGGTVTFSSGPGNNDHDARFPVGSSPSVCNPPLPGSPAPPSWSSTCTFNAPGTYSFVCTAHPGMGGSVEVVDAGTPTTPPPTTTGPGTPPPGDNPPGGSPSDPDSFSVKVPRRQRGTLVRGSVTTSEDDSRLSIRALVSNRLLATSPPRRIRNVSVGSLRRLVVNAGKTAFVLKLNRAARRALNRRDRLTVRLRITVTPPGGAATTKTARVSLRAA